MAISVEQIAAFGSGDYDPIFTRVELADASDIVVEATLVDAVDGRVHGASADDEFAGRYLRLVFESEDLDQRLLVEVPRPSESPSLTEVLAGVPLGARNVIYVSRVEIPADSSQFWHALPEGEAIYQFTLPNGWIIESDGSVSSSR